MTGKELLNYLRTDILRDAVSPYLWSDALLYRLLSQGEAIHARRTHSIVDDTQTISTSIDEPGYDLPEGTIFVLSARVDTRSRDMPSYTRKAIPSHLLTSTGEPSIFTLDERTNALRVYPVPDAAYTINLRTARLPSTAIASAVTPEIPTRYHEDLAEYAAWRALQSNDVDGQNTKSAERHKADWEQRVSDAKRELYRMQLGSNPSAVSSWTGKRNR